MIINNFLIYQNILHNPLACSPIHPQILFVSSRSNSLYSYLLLFLAFSGGLIFSLLFTFDFLILSLPA